ncbi:MAG: hypothetical protein K2P76_01305 [Lachnospiraceae bacterium]|nr:hypothetical protein [Lachnospiraceae bacterium]MDE6979824.1 hypothetical protein [Lachnospiraceae bacterium]
MGKDYLVNGAKLVCICGSKIGKLKIPKGHGDASKKKKKALCKRGGLIMPVTSRQGFDKRINWEVFLRRLLKMQRWALGKNLMCNIFGQDPI